MPAGSLATPVLAATDLAVGYAGHRKAPRIIVAGVNLHLMPAELVCLIGPNGAGKSTLMRTLAGMQPPLAGRIQINGTDLNALPPRELARRLSIVLTDRVDVGILSAHMLVALGRYPYTGWSGRLRPEDEVVVEQAIEAVGAADLAGRNVAELSDGERQKIMIARALAQEPVVLLLDEPTAFLDMPRRAELMTMLRRLARQSNRAILLSTHDLDLALRSADRIALLPKGGTLQIGAPEDLVLNGLFEAAFQAEGMAFDAYSGSFKTASAAAGIIDVTGDGLPAVWTRRALEREGFCVTAGSLDAPIHIILTQAEGQTRWQVRAGEANQLCASLYEVLALVKQFTP